MRNAFITSVNLCLSRRLILLAVLVSLSAISNVCLLVSNAFSSQKSENHGVQPNDNHYYIAVDSDAKTHRLSKLKLKTTVGIGTSFGGSFDATISKFDSKLSATDNSSMQFSVTEHLMTYLSYDEIKSQYSNCETPPNKTTFFDTDYFATLWFSFQGAIEGDTLKAKWYAPDGTLYGEMCTTLLNTYGCLTGWIYIKEYTAASKLGNWQVKVYRDDSLVFTENFTIQEDTLSATPIPTSSTQFSIMDHLMTYLSYNELNDQNSYCGTPPKKTTFYNTDSFAMLWFSFQNAVEGDTFKVKWYAPSGTLYGTVAATIEYSYQYSYSWMAAWIYIKRYPAASKLGKWQVKVFRNDSLLFTENFKIRKKRKKTTSAATQTPTSTSTEAFIPAATPMILKHSVISRERRINQFTDKTTHGGRRP